jgi:hypothetical protein
MCSKCVTLTGSADRAPTPWERRAELGLFQAYWLTWKEVMFAPDLFYRKLRPDGATQDAFLYAWFTGLLVLVPNFLLQAYNYDQFRLSMEIAFKGVPHWMEHLTRWEWAAALALPAIVLFPIGFYLGAGAQHLGCLMWTANKNGFTATARTLGYGQSATVAAAIPVIGGLLLLYVFALNVIGIARTQDVSVGRAIGAVLTIPLIAGCCGGVGVVIVAVMAVSRLH